jgi:hypothetical protein
MRYISRLILIVTLLAPIILASVPEYADCPRDGQQAPKISESQISLPNCPGTGYNAVEATYSHTNWTSLPPEKHTFTKTACLN